MIIEHPMVQQQMNFAYKPIQVEIAKENMWGQSPRVNFKNSPHRDIFDIILRGPVGWETDDLITLHQQVECEDYPAMHLHPLIRDLVVDLSIRLDSTKLGRVILAKVPPGKTIHPHADEGPVPDLYTRYHCIVRAAHRCWFLVDDKAVNMTSGEIWKVDVSRQHCVVNLSDFDRTHLILDMVT